MSKSILHISVLDKFIPGFIDFIRSGFDIKSHQFITFGDKKKYSYKNDFNISHYDKFFSLKSIFGLFASIKKSDKVILHGLFNWQLIFILLFFPWWHGKIYWVIWGGDLYCHERDKRKKSYKIMEILKRTLISRLGGIITYIEGDYERAKDWYHAKGILHKCIMYTSNIYHENDPVEKIENNEKLNLLIGNSSDSTNKHLYIMDKIYKSGSIELIDKIYCPLSYGDRDNAIKVKDEGERRFGNKFVPIINHMPLNEYNKILDAVDIAIFAHRRQQAMGNTINLLGRGKKVYMNPQTSSYDFLNTLGVEIFSIEDLEMSRIDEGKAKTNNFLIKNYFNENNLLMQLSDIFES